MEEKKVIVQCNAKDNRVITKVFERDTTLGKMLDWAQRQHGATTVRVMIEDE